MKRNLQRLLLAGSLIVMTVMAYAQSTIKGKVVDASTGETLPGANVVIDGTTIGTTTNLDGEFSLKVTGSEATIVITYVGFQSFSKTVLTSEISDLGEIKLAPGAQQLSAVEKVASRTTSESPFTFTDISKKEIQQNLGSRDVPHALNTSPSVYATNQGGGAGDSRITIRGFNNQNVAVMINGVPVNDMENGLVYWSNWDGVGDAARSIQVQRGISPVSLAVPSVGGTMNVITDPAAQAEGLTVKQEMGSWAFKKTTVNFNSGLINEKFAFSGTMVRKTGEGFYQGTYTDAWAYHVGLSYQASENDKIELYTLGAPQRHGQNLYMQNIGRYSKKFALDQNDYDPDALNDYKEAGRNFNQNYNGVSETYLGQQYDGMYKEGITSRHDKDFIMERENSFHKPLINLNWFHSFSDDLQWSTVAYWSGGRGGGSGTLGSVSADYSYDGMAVRQWDAEIAQNSDNIDAQYSTSQNRSTGILRNSRNNQYTIGVISKLYYDVSENLAVEAGIDWRTATITHYREVRDLLGGDYYVFDGNDFDDLASGSYMKRLGDKVDYYNENKVNWIGGYAQAQYNTENIGVFLMGGLTTVKYDYTDFFTSDGGKELNIKTDGLPGYQIKGGFTYKFSPKFNAYVNGGHISRNPIFDYAINDASGVAYEDPENEKITTFEVGTSYSYMNKLALNLSYYNTLWSDRTITRPINNLDGTEDFLFIGGLEQNHSGVEIDVTYKPVDIFTIQAGASMANWEYGSDVTAVYTTYENGSPVDEEVNLYVNGLKVGDAPQNQFYVTAEVMALPGWSLKMDARIYDKFYSNFNALDRDDENDRAQSWQVPGYTVFDFHTFYDVPLKTSDFSVQVFAHVFNVFDALYIQDATDNSQYNSFDDDHDADDAEVFFGLPRNFNIGASIRF